MDKKLMWILIIIGLIVLAILIPKPYSVSSGKECEPSPFNIFGGCTASGSCIGLIYKVNETVKSTPINSSCIDYKRGWACRGIAIQKEYICIK